jgi:hypothetical protein
VSELSSVASVVEVERGLPVCDFTDKTNSKDKRKVGHMLIDVHSIRNIVIIYQHVAHFSFVLTVGFVCEITDWETTLNFDHRGN